MYVVANELSCICVFYSDFSAQSALEFFQSEGPLVTVPLCQSQTLLQALVFRVRVRSGRQDQDLNALLRWQI